MSGKFTTTLTIIILLTGCIVAVIALGRFEERVTRLELQLASALELMESRPQPAPVHTITPTVIAPAANSHVRPAEPAAESATVDVSGEAPPAVSALIEPFTTQGYMYGRDWEAMEPELAAMSVEENRRFWEEMLRAIDEGAVEFLDE